MEGYFILSFGITFPVTQGWVSARTSHNQSNSSSHNGQRGIQRGERVTLGQVESITRANSLPMTPAEE